ncbi:hypothetical protein MMC18_008322 [Xylographa bjoerkii]|nr:hypothetical protein [Xylographa bjoerkii]
MPALGIQPRSQTLNWRQLKKCLMSKIRGVLSMTKTFMPLLVKSKGTVVNISSVGAVIHSPWIGIYSSSKAALTIASETLRLEVEPFGVRVITAMVGAVDTNIYSNNSIFKLPAGSLYMPIEQRIADINAGKNSLKGADVNTFAKKVIDDILKGNKGQLWRGRMASMARWVSILVP